MQDLTRLWAEGGKEGAVQGILDFGGGGDIFDTEPRHSVTLLSLTTAHGIMWQDNPQLRLLLCQVELYLRLSLTNSGSPASDMALHLPMTS